MGQVTRKGKDAAVAGNDDVKINARQLAPGGVPEFVTGVRDFVGINEDPIMVNGLLMVALAVIAFRRV